MPLADRRRLAALATLALAVLVPARAHAKSCIDHAYERMELERTGVFLGSKPVEPPPELGTVDELLNGAAQGKSVLLWEKSTMGFGKFYALAEAWAPDPAIASWLDATSKKTLMTGCGYAVAYTPVLPGRYRFDQEHMGGERTPKGIDDPEVLVAPGRDRIELRFTVNGKRFRAAYAVRCASFEWTPSAPKVCAKSVASPWPASVEALPEPKEDAPVAAPASASPAGPPPSISVESAPIAAPAPDPRSGRGCGSCAVGGARDDRSPAVGLGLLLGVLGLRVRRRAGVTRR